MTDKELLELAAKAAGIEKDWSGAYFSEKGGIWNPLTDDGDALRLAVKLNLIVCLLTAIERTFIYFPAENIGGKFHVVEQHNDDPYAATRRAIVRAAAELGRMK